MDQKRFAELVERIFFPSNVGIATGIIILVYLINGGNIVNNIIAFLVSTMAYFLAIGYFKWKFDEENQQYVSATVTATLVFAILNLFIKISFEFSFAMFCIFTLSIIGLIIRPRWKISGHTIAITTACTFLSIIDSMFFPLYILCPIIYWSRLKLKRHTPAQVVAGIILGLTAPVFIWMVLA